MVVVTANHGRGRAIVTVPAGARWRDFHAEVAKVIGAEPALTQFDWIIDDQGPMDDVDVEEMAKTGALFQRLNAAPDQTTFTVVVSRDRFFHEWARVIDRHYGNRRHHAAPTLAEAVALMDRLERERAL
jgi:hypothetical protein